MLSRCSYSKFSTEILHCRDASWVVNAFFSVEVQNLKGAFLLTPGGDVGVNQSVGFSVENFLRRGVLDRSIDNVPGHETFVVKYISLALFVEFSGKAV